MLAIFLGAMLIVAIVISIKHCYGLSEHRDFTIGKVVAITGMVRGVPFIDYEYRVNNKTYVKSARLDGYRADVNSLSGKFFFVVFDSLDPIVSDILIRQRDYSEYNHVCPDSLKWAAAH